MAGNNNCIDLRLVTECTKQLDLTPDPVTPWMAEQKDGKILVLCPQKEVRYNFCVSTVGTDGTKYGFLSGSFGLVNPTHTADGTMLHEFTWQADGTFIIAWGDTGTTQLTDVDHIVIEGSNGEHIVVWNGTHYTFNDIDMATSLIADAPSEVCMEMLILPDLFIHYDFNMLLRGA